MPSVSWFTCSVLNIYLWYILITELGIWYAQHCFTLSSKSCSQFTHMFVCLWVCEGESIDMCTGKTIKFSVKHGLYARLKLLNHVAIYLFIRSEFSDLMLRLALPQPHITASLQLNAEKRNCHWYRWQLATRLEFIALRAAGDDDFISHMNTSPTNHILYCSHSRKSWDTLHSLRRFDCTLIKTEHFSMQYEF